MYKEESLARWTALLCGSDLFLRVPHAKYRLSNYQALHEFFLTLTIEQRLSSDTTSFKGKGFACGFILLYPAFIFHLADFKSLR